MDPYLEHPARWQGVHNKLITHVEEALNAVLPAGYVANVEARCYIEAMPGSLAGGPVRPDVSVTRSATAAHGSRAGAAELEPAAGSFIVAAHPPEIREAYVEIVDAADRARVVTSIEILSPTNKSARGRGRRLYLRKQRTVLQSPTHLLEVDLLRDGLHTVAAPLEHAETFRSDYLVCLHRSYQPAQFQVWPFTVRDPLPAIWVPLDQGIPEIGFALQPLFDVFYDAGAYRKKTDYTMEAEPPLALADASWAASLFANRAGA